MFPMNSPRVNLSGWLVFYDDGSSMKSFKTHANSLQSVTIDWIHCTSQGVVARQPHPTASEKADLLSVARKNGVKVYALAANDGFKPDGVEVAMASPQAMKAHADALAKIALEEGVDGIDLDYESLKGSDRQSFTKLVQMIADALHAKKLKLVMAVHAKESEPGNWDGPQAQDYAALGKAADSIRVMTYDFHWETSEAGPISPPDWVERVMTFAATQIPPKKLEVGIAGYGYDWLAKKADGVDWTQWSGLVTAYGSAKRDPASQELVLSHNNRTAYFVDGEAARSKIAIAKKLGLNGLALWRLGSEDPGFWPIFDQLSK